MLSIRDEQGRDDERIEVIEEGVESVNEAE